MHDPSQTSALISHPEKTRRIVLNVEDDTASTNLVAAMFSRRCDLKLLSATHCLEGLELARSDRPHAILMNIDSREASLRVFGLLHDDPTTTHIPVIAVSSDARPHEIKDGLSRGFFRYLVKPYRLEDLMRAVDDALQYATDNSLLT